MKKKLLYIVPHDFFPAENGGQLRVFHILKALSEKYDTTIVYFSNDPNNHALVAAQMPHCKLIQLSNPQTKLSVLQSLKVRWALRKFSGLDVSSMVFYELMLNTLRHQDFDLIFYEHLESLSIAGKLCRKYFKNAYRIANLHNIDHEVWAAQYASFPDKHQYLKYSQNALNAEKSLYKHVDLALLCSPDDETKIHRLNKLKLKTLVVPNGTSIPAILPAAKVPNSLLFVGSLDYFPNTDGLTWFYENIWPKLLSRIPDTTLVVVGRGNVSNLGFMQHPQIKIIGRVENVSEFYFNAQISIVPLLDGSGTRLKIPEAMAHAVPVVSTSKGAEGNAYTHGINIMLADNPDDFANAIATLFTSEALHNNIKMNALSWVKENLDWETIGSNLVQELQGLIQ